MVNPPALSVCIPIYRSRDILESRLGQVLRILQELEVDYEILLCNDDASDETQRILQKLAGQTPSLRLFRNETNRGLGYSLRRMFAQARGEFVCYTDIDLSFQFQRIGEFIDLMKNADVVVASRYAGIAAPLPRHRRLFSRLYFRLCRRFLDVPVKDVGSGFVLIRKSCLDNLHLVSDRFGIHAELHARLARVGCRYCEVPVRYTHWSESQFSVFKHSFSTLAETVKVWRQMRRSTDKARALSLPVEKIQEPK